MSQLLTRAHTVMIMESVAVASQPKENHDDAPQLLIIIIVSPITDDLDNHFSKDCQYHGSGSVQKACTDVYCF